jgi:hypothetical protein
MYYKPDGYAVLTGGIRIRANAVHWKVFKEELKFFWTE